MAHDVNQGETDVVAQVRSALIGKISADRLELWIPPDTTWNYQNGVLSLVFAEEFASQLCRKMLLGEISRAMAELLGTSSFEIQFSVVKPSCMVVNSLESQVARSRPSAEAGLHVAAGVKASAARLATCDTLTPAPDANGELPSKQPKDSATGASAATSQLWNSIVAGDSNQLAWTAIRLVLAEPGKISPVMVYGPSGTGKSMLLSATAQRMRNELRMKRVVHLTSEQFTNDFTESLQCGGLPLFRKKYRDVDALILDDLQFLAGKRSTLAEVKHTIDILLRSGKQVVLAADRPLQELSALGEDLLGRVRGGLMAPMLPLDQAIRISLLRQQTRDNGIQLSDSILQQLASRLAGDGRLIRGVVNRLKALSAICQDGISWDQCWNAVMDLVQATQPVVRLEDIERAVCSMFGLAPDSLQSSSKLRTVSQPRMLAMFLARKYTPAAYKEIGDFFGKRRHSTVISAEKTVSCWLEENTMLDGHRRLSVREAVRYVEAQLQVG